MLRLIEAESTYLAWIDCHALGLDAKQLERLWRRRPHSKRLFRALVEAAATSQGVHGRPTPEA